MAKGVAKFGHPVPAGTLAAQTPRMGEPRAASACRQPPLPTLSDGREEGESKEGGCLCKEMLGGSKKDADPLSLMGHARLAHRAVALLTPLQ